MAPMSNVLTSRDDELDMPTRALSTLSMWLYGSETQVRLKRPCSIGDTVVRVGAHAHRDEYTENGGEDSTYPLDIEQRKQILYISFCIRRYFALCRWHHSRQLL